MANGYLRFLRPGRVEVELPEDFEIWPPEKQLAWGNKKLSLCDDEELVEAMSDYTPEIRAKFGCGFFDDSLGCDAVEVLNEHDDPTTIAWTKDWEAWAFNNNSDSKGLVDSFASSQYYGELFDEPEEDKS